MAAAIAGEWQHSTAAAKQHRRVLVAPRYPGEPSEHPLHAACFESDAGALASMLVDLGVGCGAGVVASAALEAVDFQGYTPLMRAASNGSAECCGLLVAAGADPSHAASSGRTALHYACECPLAESVGHDAADPDVAGNVIGGNPGHVTALLKARDQWGWAPNELARHFNHARTHALLTTAALDPKRHLEQHRASVTAFKQAHNEKVSERFGKADKAMSAGTPICVAGYGRGVYTKWSKTILGGNEHFVEMEKGAFPSESRDGWVANDVLPIKLKSETWTVYSAEFDTVEALVMIVANKGNKKPSKVKMLILH